MGSRCQKWGADPHPWCWVPNTCPNAHTLGGNFWHHCGSPSPMKASVVAKPATDASRLAKLEKMLSNLKHKEKPKKLTKLQQLQQQLQALKHNGARRLHEAGISASASPAWFVTGFVAALGSSALVGGVAIAAAAHAHPTSDASLITSEI